MSAARDPTKPDPILDNMPKYNKYDPAARELQQRVEGLDFGAEELLNRNIGNKNAVVNKDALQIQENNVEYNLDSKPEDIYALDSPPNALAKYSAMSKAKNPNANKKVWRYDDHKTL